MTYLELAIRAAQECRLARRPTTVTGLSGDLLDLVLWVRDAWTEIQNRHENWRWMRAPFTVNTVASTDSYAYGSVTDELTAAAITRFGRWLMDDPEDPGKLYLQSGGVGVEQYLSYVPWNWFKSQYRIGTQVDGHPRHVAVDPQNKLILGPAPDAVYVVTGDYQRAADVWDPEAASADDFEPDMPERFHMAIVYRAMEKYAGAKSMQEVMVRGTVEGGRLLRQLEVNQLPAMRLAAPMA